MGSNLTKELVQGILVPDEYLTSAAMDLTNATQQGPRPGVAVPKSARTTLRPVITAAQTEAVTVGATRGGGVGAAEIAYRLNSEAAADYRGWQSPNGPVWTGMLNKHPLQRRLAGFDSATHPKTQDVYVPHVMDDVLLMARWRQSDWTNNITLIASGAANVYAGRIAATPTVHIQDTGRIVVWNNGLSFYSDDLGNTWQVYARDGFPIFDESGPLPLLSRLEKQRVREVGGQLICIALEGLGNWSQWASKDRGKTWDYVDRASAGTAMHDIDIAEMPDGTAYLAFTNDRFDALDCDALALRLASAYQPITEVFSTAVTVFAGDATNKKFDRVAIASDPDGTLVMSACYDDTTATTGTHGIACKKLGQFGWFDYLSGMCNMGTDEMAPTNLASCWSLGQHIVITNNVPRVSRSRSQDPSVLRMIALGGWSTLVGDCSMRRLDSPAFGTYQARYWYPINVPSTGSAFSGFTTSGSATLTAEYLQIAGTNYGYAAALPVAAFPPVFRPMGITAQWQCSVQAADTSGTNLSPGVELVTQASSARYRVRVVYRTGGIIVHDVLAGSAIANIIIDTSVPRIYHLHVTGTGAVRFAIRSPGSTVWQQHTGTAIAGAGGAAGNSVTFGSQGATTVAQSRWYWFQVRSTLDSALDELQNFWVTGRNELVGRPLNGLPTPVPVIGTTTQQAYMHSEGGDAPDLAEFDVDAAHDYPAANMLPAVQPSPAVGWRSTSTAEQLIVFEPSKPSGTAQQSYLGKLIGLYVEGCNFRTLHLEGSDTGSSWTPLATLDLCTDLGAAGALSYKLTGEVVTVEPASAEAAKYIFGEDLRGSRVLLNATKSRKIAANLSGQWGSTGTTVRPALRLEAVDGTETAIATCMLQSHKGICFVDTSDLQYFKYWRIRIPAGQVICDVGDDPETGYRIGSMVLGEVVTFGAGTNSQWSETTDPNYTESVTRRGTKLRTKNGPPQRTWTMQWAEADRFLDSQSPDYVQRDNTMPLAARAEVYEQLRAIADRSDSFAVPMVALRYIPADGGNVTNPDAMLYGHLDGSVELQSVFAENDYTAHQVVRGGLISINEVI